MIVKLLSALGCGFDCATQSEMDLVINGLGSDLNFTTPEDETFQDKIVYANPQKYRSHIEYAA